MTLGQAMVRAAGDGELMNGVLFGGRNLSENDGTIKAKSRLGYGFYAHSAARCGWYAGPQIMLQAGATEEAS
jgi:hypothetical protein